MRSGVEGGTDGADVTLTPDRADEHKRADRDVMQTSIDILALSSLSLLVLM